MRNHWLTSLVGSLRWMAVAVLFVVLAAPPAATALEPRGGDIPAGSVVEDDVLLSADDVTLIGTVNGDLVALGKHVTINGEVSGSVLAAGDTVTINGQVRGGVYALALDVELGPRAVVGRNAHLVGVDVHTAPGSIVGRDVTVGAYRAVIGGELQRDLKTAVLLLDLQGQLRGRPPRSTPAPAAAPASARLRLDPSPPGAFLLPISTQLDATGVPDAAGFSLRNWPGDFARNAVILLLVGAVLLWLSPRPLVDCSERLGTGPLPAVGYGVLAFVLFYFSAAAVAVLIAIAGIALVLMRVGGSVLPLYSFGFFGIGFVLSAFTLFFSTVSQVVAALLIGSLAWRRLAPGRPQERALALVAGTVLLSLFVAVPFIGPAVEALVGLTGLGAAWLAIRDGREKHLGAAPVATAAGE